MSEEKKEGPGAATATAPKETPIIEVDGHVGHTLEPDYKRLPIGPDHILYPVVVGLVLSVLPALEAHTRLLLGRYLEYRVTEKT